MSNHYVTMGNGWLYDKDTADLIRDGGWMERSTIWVQWDREGFHNYPDAPEEVAFLRLRHRHVFKFRAEVEVFHDDRDIEFFMLKKELQNNVWPSEAEFNHRSCEMLAKDVVNYIATMYPGRAITVTCSEDGENGATFRYAPAGKEML